MLAADNWCIKVSDRVYGPYTQHQMAGFVTEGRLSGHSLVAPAGGQVWREARQYPPLASLLEGPAKPAKSFGKAAAGGREKGLAEGEKSNFVIIFDATKGTSRTVEEEIRRLGNGFRITDNVWILTTTQSALGVRNNIAPHLDVRESLFVIDCDRGRTSWTNFVPDIHAKLTKAWVTL
ncbi:MAG: GYF domain-containing protein [Pseudomonadota bacterium]